MSIEGHQVVQAVDLFAGAGGLTLGLKAAGVETVCAVEYDRDAVRTFVGHTPGADIIDADITAPGVLSALARYRGSVDLVYGGPPCQPFSSGGLRQATSDLRDMIPSFIEAVRLIRPTVFLMENVPGLLAGERSRYLHAIVAEFEREDYCVVARVLNAADYGVPQKRRRLFVVGMRGTEFGFPPADHGPGRRYPFVRVRDVLPPYQIGEPNPSVVVYARNPDPRPSPYDGHLFNGGGRPINPDAPSHTILAAAGGNKTHFFDDRGIVPEYHRHILAGGEPRSGILPGARRLTVLESATLQTFPSDTTFKGARSSHYSQIGNAVPPKLAYALGDALLKQLDGSDAAREVYVYSAQPRLPWA